MAFLKKYPILTAILVLCLLGFLGGAYLYIGSRGAIASLKDDIERSQNQLRMTASQSPAPSQANVEAAQANLDELKNELERSIATLERGRPLRTSEDPFLVLTEIQSMIQNFRRQALRANVQIDEEEGFGFAPYREAIEFNFSPEVTSKLDMQRQIVLFAVNQLIQVLSTEGEAQVDENGDAIVTPFAINAVERSHVEAGDTSASANPAPRGGRGERLPEDIFKIDPLISASREGAIETMAFRFRFTGYTSDLREFINALVEADLPIVIRSVEAEPAQESTAQRTQTQSAPADDFMALFGGASTPEDAPEPETLREPIIESIASTFSVTIEYIDVTLDTVAENRP